MKDGEEDLGAPITVIRVRANALFRGPVVLASILAVGAGYGVVKAGMSVQKGVLAALAVWLVALLAGVLVRRVRGGHAVVHEGGVSVSGIAGNGRIRFDRLKTIVVVPMEAARLEYEPGSGHLITAAGNAYVLYGAKGAAAELAPALTTSCSSEVEALIADLVLRGTERAQRLLARGDPYESPLGPEIRSGTYYPGSNAADAAARGLRDLVLERLLAQHPEAPRA